MRAACCVLRAASALDAGYGDQAHFAHEVRALTAQTATQLVGSGEPARRKNQVTRARAARITEDIITTSTTVTELWIGPVSRMLFSQLGRVWTRRLEPVTRI
jgi:hypothetical protein